MHLLSVTLALSVLLAAHELRTKGEHEIDGSTVWLTICTPPCSERPAGSQQLTKPPSGPERRALAAWARKRGRCGALVPAQRSSLNLLPLTATRHAAGLQSRFAAAQ